MGRWKRSRILKGIVGILLVLSMACTTVSGMLLHGTRQYANTDTAQEDNSQFFVSQDQMKCLLDGYLRLYKQYMEIGSIIAADGMINYDTVLLQSMTDPTKKYTLRDLVKNAASNGVYAGKFRKYMNDFAKNCQNEKSYSLETQYRMETRDNIILDSGQIYQFTNHSGTGIREKQLENAEKYKNNMEVVSNLTQNYGKHYDNQLQITIGHLDEMSMDFTAGSAFEKYLITYYSKYAKWYFLEKLYEDATDDQGGWSEEFNDFYRSYKKQNSHPVSREKCYEAIRQEMEDTYAHIPNGGMPWSMHRIPRSMEIATDYAVFLIETYQELHYLFSQTNFCYAYLDSAGMLLTNNENWWQQVQRIVAAGQVEEARDNSNLLFCYYDNKDYNAQSNLLWDTLQMSGNIQETLISIGENYQNRSYHIAIGVDFNGVKKGMIEDEFSEQYQTSKVQAIWADWGATLFYPSLIVMIVALLLMILQAGYRSGSEEIVLSGIDELWVELLVIGGLFLAKVYNWTLQMWDGSMVRLEFGVVAGVLFILQLVAVRVVLSVAKRIKSHCLARKSIVVRFIHDVIIGKMKIREVGKFLQTMFWELPLVQRYATLFLLEGILQAYLLWYVLWSAHRLHGGLRQVLATRYGVIAVIVYVFFLLGILFLQLRLYHNEKIDRKIIADVEKIAEGDFALHIPTPQGVSYERKHMISLLNRIGMTADEAVEKSIRSERLKTELIANVSHDIKTPLTSIINYVDLMKRQQPENPQILEYMDILDRKSQRLKVLIEDLIEASKASSGAMELNMQPLDFGELILQTNGEFQDYFAEVDLNLVSEVPDEQMMFMGDGRRVYRVLENLYMNTRKYALPGTRVYVKLQQRQDQLLFSIKNVSAAKLNITPEELTERFVRGDSSRSTEGSGLGLSIAKNLTELMGGTFQIILDGDLFRVEVCFPVYQKPEPQEQ